MIETGVTGNVHAVLSGPVASRIDHDESRRQRTVDFHEKGVFPEASIESGGVGLESMFAVRLPALRSDEAHQASAALPGPVASAKRGHPRVLIVDDNEDATELLAETLNSAGYETMVAFDGPEALRVVATTPPDVALIDIGLPVMDGYELAAHLREARPASALRLIALTGYGQERDRERSRAVGFDLHLVKPVDLDTLLHAIESRPE